MRPLPKPLVVALEDGGRGLRIAVVRLGAMGDILRALPAARLLRFSLPDARIHWVCDDRWAFLLDGHRDFDGVLPLPRKKLRAAATRPARWAAAWGELAEFRAALRRLRCGLALDFHGNFRSGLVLRWSGAAVRLGHGGHQQKEGNRLFTTHRVDEGERRRSRMDRNLDLIRALGLPDGPLPDAGLRFPRAALQAGRAVLEDLGAPFAVLNPGASPRQAYKKPPALLLAAAARRVSEEGLIPLVVWGPGEEADAREVVAASGGLARLAPPTDVATLGVVLRRANLFVGGDTGPLHLACAVGCPVVAIYGPTDPAVNAPWRVRSRSVYPESRRYTGVKSADRRAGGFEGIEADDVARAIVAVLDESSAALTW